MIYRKGLHPNSLKNLNRTHTPNSSIRQRKPFTQRAREAAKSLIQEQKIEFYQPIIELAVKNLQDQIEARLDSQGGAGPAPDMGLVRIDDTKIVQYRGRLTAILCDQLTQQCPLSAEGDTWESLIVLRTLTLALKGNPVALREVWNRTDGKVEQDLVFKRGQEKESGEDGKLESMSWAQLLQKRYERRLAEGLDPSEAIIAAPTFKDEDETVEKIETIEESDEPTNTGRSEGPI